MLPPDRITVLTKPGCLLIMNFSAISLKGQMTGTEIVKILLTGKIKESNLSIREDKILHVFLVSTMVFSPL